MWHHQRFSLKTQSRTHAKMSDLMWMRQDEEKKKDHRLIRVTPSIQTLEIPERARPSEAKKRYGVSKYRIRTHMNGVRPTQSPDPAPEVTRPQSPGWPPQTLQLGSHIQSPGWPPQTLHLGSHVHSLQGDPPQTLHLGSHVQSPGWPHFTDPAPGVTRPQSPGWPPQTLHLRSHVHSLQGDAHPPPRPCTGCGTTLG